MVDFAVGRGALEDDEEEGNGRGEEAELAIVSYSFTMRS